MKKLPFLITFALLFGCVPPIARAGTSNVTVNNLTGSLNMGQMGAGVELGFSVPTGYTLRFKSGSTLIIDAGATLTGFPAAILNGGLTGNGFVYANGTNSITSTAAATNGQLLIGRTGLPPLAASLTGTANQIVVTPGAGTLTLSTPQDIGTTSAPSFARVNLSTATGLLGTFNDTAVNGALISFTHSATQYGAIGGAKQVFGGSELTTDLGIAAGGFADRIRIGSTPGGPPAVSIDQNGLTANLVGVTTNSDAPAGAVGEFVSSTIASGSAVALTTGTATNVTSISLSAGDWDVTGIISFLQAGGTTVTTYVGSISLVSSTGGGDTQSTVYTTGLSSAGTNGSAPLPTVRFALATTTTVYLVGFANFGGSTLSAFGTIRARRMR